MTRFTSWGDDSSDSDESESRYRPDFELEYAESVQPRGCSPMLTAQSIDALAV
jgi:hypothetical protein